MQRIIKEIKRRFRNFGYQEFKVNLFENYDYYFQNREFVDDTNILKVIHPSGQLYGLQADITISATKSFINQSKKHCLSQKYFYYAQTYESTTRTNIGIKINNVIGVEWFGVNDIYADVETILLANLSLASLKKEYILELSHIHILKSLCIQLNLNDEEIKIFHDKVASKNSDALKVFLEPLCLDLTMIEKIIAISQLRGNFEEVLIKLKGLLINEELGECYNYLKELESYLGKQNLLQSIYLDFSLINRHSYYTGIIMQGFINGIHKAILRGGRYDYIRNKVNHDFQATGFSIELGELEAQIKKSKAKIDYLVIYEHPDENLYGFVSKLQEKNLSVCALNYNQIKTDNLDDLLDSYKNIHYYQRSDEHVS